MSRTTLALSLAAVGFAALLGGTPASAAPASPSPLALLSSPIAIEAPGVQTVHWRGGYCRNWRFTCADRWGWQTQRFYRCLRRHDC